MPPKKCSQPFIANIKMKGSCTNYFVSDHVTIYSHMLNLLNFQLKYSDLIKNFPLKIKTGSGFNLCNYFIVRSFIFIM